MDNQERHYLTCQSLDCQRFACVARREYEEQIRKLRVALEGLVKLKNHKDTYGNDASHQNLHPVIWENARKAVNMSAEKEN